MKHKFRSWNKVFRSWNEELKQFFYFEGGIYQRCGIDRDEFNLSLFKWENAEQSTKIANTECFVNDMLAVEISYSPFGKPDEYQEEIFKGVLKVDNLGFYLENDCEPIYLINLPTIICIKIIGNIHQNKEILEDMKSD
jgi:hypothetical protein